MADVKIVVSLDGKAATEAAKRLDDEVRKLGGGAGVAGKETGLFGQKITGLIPSFTAASIAADIIRSGFRFLKNEVRETIEAAIEAEKANKALDSALLITGRGAAQLGDHFKAYAEELMKVTIYDDEAIKSAQALMLTLARLDRDGMDQATRGAIGLASTMGMDLGSAATVVAKAMAGNVGILGRYGITISETLPLEEKRAELLKKLEVLFGRATAETQTFGGQLSQLKNRWGEIQEAAGGFLTSQRGVIELLNKGSQAILDYLMMDEMLARATGRQVENENRLADRLGKAAAAAGWQYGAMSKLIEMYGGITPALIKAITHEEYGVKIKNAYIQALRDERIAWERNAAIRKKAEEGTNDLAISYKLLDTAIDSINWGRHRVAFQALLDSLYPVEKVIEGTLPAVNKLSKEYQILSRMGLLVQKTNPWAKMQEDVQRYSETAGAALGGLDAVIQQGSANRMIALDNEYSKRLALINASITDEDSRQQAIAKLDDEFAAKRKKAAHALGLSAKAIAISNAIISTHEAAAKAMAQGGFILGIPWAAIIEALGWIQVGLIAAQPIPLAKGGYFKRETVLAGRDADYRLADNAGHEEIVSPVPMMRSIVREELTRLVPAMAGSFTLMGGIHIHTDRQVDGAAIFRELEQQARIRGFRLGGT
jgi:hypothetical protein